MKENGVIAPKIEYPAAFVSEAHQSKINGIICKHDIHPKEVICFIPNNIIISTEHARHSELAHIFKQHEDVFAASPERDFAVLVLFLMFERAKGEVGFWHPYFEVASINDMPLFWKEEVMETFNDKELVNSSKKFKEIVDKEWETLSSIIEAYSAEVFGEDKVYDYNLYKWACNFVYTRDYGWGCPHLCLLPLIDMANHDDKTKNNVDLFHSKLHIADNKIYSHFYSFNTDE
jgi:hypothetical protein